MTYRQFIKALAKVPASQLDKPVKLFEGCSGNWDTVTSVEVADEDEWHEGEEPGTERHKALTKYGPVTPAAKKGDVFILHDH